MPCLATVEFKTFILFEVMFFSGVIIPDYFSLLTFFTVEWTRSKSLVFSISISRGLIWSEASFSKHAIFLPSGSKITVCFFGEGLPPTPNWYALFLLKGDWCLHSSSTIEAFLRAISFSYCSYISASPILCLRTLSSSACNLKTSKLVSLAI